MSDNDTDFEKFIKRLQQQRQNYALSGHNKLDQLVKPQDILNILDAILQNSNLQNNINAMLPGVGLRLDKKFTGLSRTVNIVRLESGEYMFMLETKSKLASGSKDPSAVIGKGGFGTVKPAWRIDVDPPEEWANKTSYDMNVKEAEYEAKFSQNIVSINDNKNHFVNVTCLGQLFFKLRKVATPFGPTEDPNAPKVTKVSQYSKRADYDLERLPPNTPIQDKNKLILDILQGVKLMHDKGLVHQDLKPKNIFVYSQPSLHAKVADFGNSVEEQNPTKQALSSQGYESPEIAFANRHNYGGLQSYYFSPNYSSYGRDISNSFYDDPIFEHNANIPSKANDMWALGIIIYELYYNEKPKSDALTAARINSDPLLFSLLTEPTNRCDIDAAISLVKQRVLVTPIAQVATQTATQTISAPLTPPPAYQQPTPPTKNPGPILADTLEQAKVDPITLTKQQVQSQIDQAKANEDQMKKLMADIMELKLHTPESPDIQKQTLKIIDGIIEDIQNKAPQQGGLTAAFRKLKTSDDAKAVKCLQAIRAQLQKDPSVNVCDIKSFHKLEAMLNKFKDNKVLRDFIILNNPITSGVQYKK